MSRHGSKKARRWQVWLRGLFLAMAIGIPEAWGVEPFSVEPVELRAGDLTASVAANVDAQGTRIFTYVNGLKMSICEVFWAAGVVASHDKSKSAATNYGNLETGSFVGIVHFLAEADEEYREDFHDQKLKPGYYTMHYAVLTGENARDFLVLSPATADDDPGRVLSIDQLIRQGRLASRTEQPALLRLVPTEVGAKELPSVRMDESGTCILQDKLRIKSDGTPAREVMLAVILVNPISEENGS